MNWLFYIVMKFNISDEAFMHGIKLAENVLTKWELKKNMNQRQRIKFMMSKP